MTIILSAAFSMLQAIRFAVAFMHIKKSTIAPLWLVNETLVMIQKSQLDYWHEVNEVHIFFLKLPQIGNSLNFEIARLWWLVYPLCICILLHQMNESKIIYTVLCIIIRTPYGHFTLIWILNMLFIFGNLVLYIASLGW